MSTFLVLKNCYNCLKKIVKKCFELLFSVKFFFYIIIHSELHFSLILLIFFFSFTLRFFFSFFLLIFYCNIIFFLFPKKFFLFFVYHIIFLFKILFPKAPKNVQKQAFCLSQKYYPHMMDTQSFSFFFGNYFILFQFCTNFFFFCFLNIFLI